MSKDRFCKSKLIKVKHRFKFGGFPLSFGVFVNWRLKFVYSGSLVSFNFVNWIFAGLIVH